ncbi:MAG TPA: hypothetical protein VNG13_03400 [Mycobacteriales bacterium]|nr:hypothetical protein [Mycobacteriales bacterium]
MYPLGSVSTVAERRAAPGLAAPYLRSRAGLRYFAPLWELRSQL